MTIEDFRNSKGNFEAIENNNTSYIGDSSEPLEKFANALTNLMDCLDPTFERLSLNEKIEKLTSSIDNPKRVQRLGGLVALYIVKQKLLLENEMDKKMKSQYDELILDKIFAGLRKYEMQEELFLLASLELLSNIFNFILTL